MKQSLHSNAQSHWIDRQQGKLTLRILSALLELYVRNVNLKFNLIQINKNFSEIWK